MPPGVAALSSRAITTLPQAVNLWDSQYQTRFVGLVDSDGDYSGNCTRTEESIPLLLTENMCASMFLDITVYCCGAVGGILRQATLGIATNSTNITSPPEGDFEPVCETSNFNDMLDCYRVTADDSCSSADVAPFGICNPRLQDTSRNSSISSNSSPSNSKPSRLAFILILLLASVHLCNF